MLNEHFRFHHLGVAVPDLAKAIPVYQDLFGYQLTLGPFDDPVQKVSVGFLSRNLTGDMVIELVAPLGDDSPVRRTLQGGQSAYHVCYEVHDIQGTINQLTRKKCIVLSAPVPAVAFNQRPIAWISTPTRQLIELLGYERI